MLRSSRLARRTVAAVVVTRASCHVPAMPMPVEIVGLLRSTITFVWDDEHKSVYPARELRRSRFEHPFLPVSLAEVRARGWSELDIIIISGDAYVDHPAFGPPLIARFLEGRGFKVGIIAQPDWRNVEAFRALGRPRLFFGIAAGNMDSMLNRLTAQKKNGGEDQYPPGGARDMRPDRATIVYANRAREAYRDVPIVLGGIEASLRRIAHYDYWSDTVRRSILLDSKADILVYGIGERPVWE